MLGICILLLCSVSPYNTICAHCSYHDKFRWLHNKPWLLSNMNVPLRAVDELAWP